MPDTRFITLGRSNVAYSKHLMVLSILYYIVVVTNEALVE